MKLSLVIEAIDKASSNVKRITGNVRDLGTRGMGVVQRATQGANRQLDRFGRGTAGRLRTLSVAAARFAGRTGLRAIEIGAEKAGWALGRLIRKGLGLAASTAKWGVAAAGFFAGWGVRNIIQTASQFEQFQIVLENNEGSAEKARKAMGWVKEFSEKTPYKVGEVMEAFVQMKQRGFDPMSGSLRALGDAASGLGEPLIQAVDAVASAVAGEYEPLRRFGIRISKSGEMLAMSYRKNGKNISSSVKDNVVEIERAVTSIFGDKFANMMDRQSRTLAGIWSNLEDKVTNFQLDIAAAGFFDKVKGKLQQVLDKVNEMAANGTLERWAKNISDWLVKMTDEAWKFFKSTKWSEVGSDLKTIARGAWAIALALGKAVEWGSRLKALFDKIPPWAKMFMPGSQGAQLFGIAGNAASWITRKDDPKKMPLPAPFPPRLPAAPFKAGHQPIKWPATSRAGSSSSAGAVQVGGRLEIELKGSGARDARVRTVQSANNDVPISVRANRGRAMETFG